MGRKLIKNPIYIIVFLSFAFLVVSPVIYTIFETAFDKHSLDNFISIFEANNLFLLFKSISLASVIAIISTALGSILGFLLYRTNIKYAQFFKIALLIPLFISPYILAVAWKDLFFMLFHSNIISSYVGVILVLSSIYTPLSMLIIGSALANIDSQYEESGLLITKYKIVVLRIIFPLIKPALISSFILVFIFSISEFSVPSYFGITVFTTKIFTLFSAFYNYSYAIIQSSLLIVICILLLYSERKYIADAPFLSFGNRGWNKIPYKLKRNSSIIGFIIILLTIVISILLPFTILLIQSYAGGTMVLIKAFNLLSSSIINSISLAFTAAIFIVVIGFIAAYYSSQKEKGISVFDWLLLLIFAIPSIIYGISLINFFNRPIFNLIYSSNAILIIAYVGKFSFIASKLIGNAISQVPKSLDEAAQIVGISLFRRKLKILLPLILPTLFAAFVLSFIFSFSELATTIMIYPPGSEIMPIKVFTIMANAPQSLISSMVLIVFALTIIIITGFYYLAKPLFNKIY